MNREILPQIGRGSAGNGRIGAIHRKNLPSWQEFRLSFLLRSKMVKRMSSTTLYKICTCFDISADYLLLGRLTSPRCRQSLINTWKHFPEPYLTLTEEILHAIEQAISYDQNSLILT